MAEGTDPEMFQTKTIDGILVIRFRHRWLFNDLLLERVKAELLGLVAAECRLLLDFGSPFYGPAAFGTSGRSPTLTEWPDGGHIGIHGTNQPELIPGRISHGCIRMTNQAILRLVPLMPIGTPVSIR